MGELRRESFTHVGRTYQLVVLHKAGNDLLAFAEWGGKPVRSTRVEAGRHEPSSLKPEAIDDLIDRVKQALIHVRPGSDAEEFGQPRINPH